MRGPNLEFGEVPLCVLDRSSRVRTRLAIADANSAAAKSLTIKTFGLFRIKSPARPLSGSEVNARREYWCRGKASLLAFIAHLADEGACIGFGRGPADPPGAQPLDIGLGNRVRRGTGFNRPPARPGG